MSASMSWGWVLFVAVMLFLAAIPSSIVALVIAHSALSVRSGIWCAIGIAAADGLLVWLALSGLSLVLEQAGRALVGALMVASGVVIALLGFVQLMKEQVGSADPRNRSARYGPFASGFALTFVDVKALAFYLVLVPALIPTAPSSAFAMAAVVAVTIATVGGVKIAYVLGADRLLMRIPEQRVWLLQRSAIVVMILVGMVATGRGALMLSHHL